MRKLKRLLFFLLFNTANFAQGGNGYVSVPIPLSAFTLGPGTTLTTLPDGTEAINGSTFSIDLGVSPAQLQADPAHPGNPGYAVDGIYTLEFTVQNYFLKYPGYYQLEIDFGNQELCPAKGWGIASTAHVIVTCPGPQYIVIDKSLPGGGPVQGTQHLVLHSANSGWQMNFKDFSLAFKPQP